MIMLNMVECSNTRVVLFWHNLFSVRSLHGLIRGENMELGRDSDTGGQVDSGSNSLRFPSAWF